MTTTGTSEVSTSRSQGAIVARAATYYRMTRYLMVVVLLGYGLWSLYDGFYKWPMQNHDAQAKGIEVLPHPGLDVPFNRVFGIVLPPLSIVMLIYILRRSRGEIRLDEQTLTAPGHPPITLDQVTAIDQRQWERKGIAYVEYDVGAKKGRVMLDDFIYERQPIDEMYEKIVAYVAPPETDSPTSEALASESPATSESGADSRETKSPGM
jgi:hypothetical protein